MMARSEQCWSQSRTLLIEPSDAATIEVKVLSGYQDLREMVTWRVGVLFSRSGATAVSETEHFFGTALAIEELNNAGGVLGRPIEPVAYDPTSDPLTYRRYAERLLGDDGVNVIFGCSTSSCRKAVLPVVERRNGLLWYPSLYEGFEYSPNVIYTGAAPNQNSFQLSEYLIQNGGRHFVADIAARKPDVVFATIVGQSARRFYRMYSDAGFDRRRRPVASLTMVEGEIAAIGAQYCDGHIASATYFSTLDQPENRSFVQRFRARFGHDADRRIDLHRRYRCASKRHRAAGGSRLATSAACAPRSRLRPPGRPLMLEACGGGFNRYA
jgi:ABC-type branched-subunit amino acid transport system substrate-binding protein